MTTLIVIPMSDCPSLLIFSLYRQTFPDLIIYPTIFTVFNFKNKNLFFLLIMNFKKNFLLALVDLITHLLQLGIELPTSLLRTQLASHSATHPVEGSVHFCLLSQARIKKSNFFDFLTTETHI
jgi:hypothetical protein